MEVQVTVQPQITSHPTRSGATLPSVPAERQNAPAASRPVRDAAQPHRVSRPHSGAPPDDDARRRAPDAAADPHPAHQVPRPTADAPQRSTGASTSHAGTSTSHLDAGDVDFEPQEDDIRVEYHPNSGRPSTTSHFEEFTRKTPSSYTPPPDDIPWWPFRSEFDYEFVRLCLAAGLNKDQVNSFIALMRRVERGGESFTFASHADMQRTWKDAYDNLTPFKKQPFTVRYKDEDLEHVLWTRNLENYAKDLLSDPLLVADMEFDAQRLMKRTGGEWERFVDEPCTANRFWDVQSKLPPGAKPLALHLYADKTKLSSFGTAKGHPVIARIANLPVHIRNGRGKGGGRIVAWLPIVSVPELPEDTTDPVYVNYKREVYHVGFRHILEPVKAPSRIGFWFRCGDQVERNFYIFIVIVSADHEEQCYLVLIRGVGSLFPCPVCLVPSKQLWDLLKTWELHTGDKAKIVLALARSQSTADAKEKILKEWGLRDKDNSFLELANSDPFRAVGFDRLHAFHLGLWGKHIWVLIKKYLHTLKAGAQFDKQMNMIPRWRGLSHFKSDTYKTSFADGKKMEDLSKNTLFVVHNILTKTASPHGYLLCSMLRSYLEVDMYLSFDVHTETTIREGEACQKEFAIRLANEKKAKDWNFIKIHSHTHGFQDILEKGVMKNHDTKPSEQMHGPNKDRYDQSNHKDTDEWASEKVAQAEAEAAATAPADETYDISADAPASSVTAVSDATVCAHYKLRSVVRASQRTLGDIELAHPDDEAFDKLHVRLNTYLTATFRAHGITIPRNAQSVQLKPSHQIKEYRQLDIFYESKVDWRQSSDIVRAHPHFHSRERCGSTTYSTRILQVD
ncbi:hypothetical protein K466DRAFT_499894 [Polyporus arcularius HHB13444]|uniref:Uncharacterized protein n=1 Tax=Polyporus arcularius HHB13444 TaxID=1314778 RepID=A0A5C3NZ79_9APHY|nr:hypothetical protein K466DRAFT_499894 [Polyporus arcularius HHB13444]